MYIYMYIYIIYIYKNIRFTLVRVSLSLSRFQERTAHLTWLSLMCTRTSSPHDSS